jgi:protein-tyrosine phosphatase
MRQIFGNTLWLGHVGDTWDPRVLMAVNIKGVVDLALNEQPATLPRELIYCRYPLLDGSGNPSWLLKAAVKTVVTLLKAKVNTFVYCGAGMSRSPCIAAAALCLLRECSPSAALALVTQSGPKDISPALWKDVQSILPKSKD